MDGLGQSVPRTRETSETDDEAYVKYLVLSFTALGSRQLPKADDA
jgi:hypothetical protein